MNQLLEEYKINIRIKVIELAKAIGVDASGIKDDDIIPEEGYLDSASIIMFILWYEEYFNLTLDEDELTIDSFGSVNAAAQFALIKLHSSK